MMLVKLVASLLLVSSSIFAVAYPSPEAEITQPETTKVTNLEPRAGPFFSHFEVKYTNTNQRPQDVIREISGKDPDINQGFGGKYVWLIPKDTSEEKSASNTIYFVKSKKKASFGAHEGLHTPDLAAGAGGDFRYLVWDGFNRHRTPIKRVYLWRTKTQQHDAPQGFASMTADINGGRGGDYLYVIW